MEYGGRHLYAGAVFPFPAAGWSFFFSVGPRRESLGARLFELSGPILVAAATPAPVAAMTEQMTLRGTLKGHNGWVTQIATTPQFPDMILSASRGRAGPQGTVG